jgi:heme A synthase
MVRRGMSAVLLFTLIEGFIGAYLVVNGLVAMNTSTERVVWMALHLTNILSLLTALTLTAWWSSGGARLKLRGQGKLAPMWVLSIVGVVALAVTGSMSALGDTLYPASSLA